MLKTLVLRKKLEAKQKELNELRAKDAELEKREAELEEAINEAAAKEDISEEERDVLDGEVDSFDAEKKEHEETKGNLEREIQEIEDELKAEEAEQDKAVEEPKAAPVVERKDNKPMEKRNMQFDVRERLEMMTRNEDVQDFLGVVRTAIKEKRAITNGQLTVPERVLPMLRERTENFSKMIRVVNLQRVSGTARQVIMGTIPEAVWTEMCANLNELDLGFNDVEIDGYKVGGFFAVCKATAEDNDVDLLDQLLDALAIAIAKALDKAIIYGTGTKMPLGMVASLALTTAPSGYPATGRTWADLSASNVLTGSGATGTALIQEIIGRAGVISDDYADNLFWAMNHKTAVKIKSQTLAANAEGALVGGFGNEMPVVGGEIIELPFIPDDNVVVGYGRAYILAERAGTSLEQSEHARFIEDQIVLKGTARYDGKPSIREAFAVFSIGTTAPVTTVTFAPDTANDEPSA